MKIGLADRQARFPSIKATKFNLVLRPVQAGTWGKGSRSRVITVQTPTSTEVVFEELLKRLGLDHD